jgi:GNAT superfamily N-acetyltransferase
MKLSCKVSHDEYTAKLGEAFDFDFDGEIVTEIRDLPELPEDFSIGLIVGPSGGGKSTLLNTLGFVGEPAWGKDESVASHFDTPEDAIEKFGAVGFNSIPQMCLPYHKLSNGEQFRCDLARKLKDGALIDEFTSVVNRDVAKSASNAFRRHVDNKGLKRIVLASCHYDILEWLRPDWVFNVLTGEFHSGRYLRRPEIHIDIYKTNWKLWDTFKKFHYLSAKINKAAHCYAAFWGEQLVGFGAVLRYPSGTVKGAWRGHRTVILPDFQGLGIGNRLSNSIAEIYVDNGGRYFSRTAHPRMGSYRDNSPLWRPTSKNRKLRTDIKHKNVYNNHYADNKRICWSHEYLGEN